MGQVSYNCTREVRIGRAQEVVHSLSLGQIRGHSPCFEFSADTYRPRLPRPSARPPARPSVRPSVRPSGSVRVRPGPSGSVRSVRSVRVRPDGLMMLITYVIHRAIDDHRSNRTRPARPARPARPGPSGPSRVRLAGWVGLSGRGLLQSMPTLQIPQYTLCAVIHWGTSSISGHGQPLVLVRS